MTAMILPSTPNHADHRRAAVELPIEMVRAELAKSSHRQLKGIRCDAVGGILVLRGDVGSYYLKQLAQETVRHLDGVQRVVNMICVAPSPDPVAPTASLSVTLVDSERVA